MAARFPDELTCDMAETYHALDWRALGLPLAATLAMGAVVWLLWQKLFTENYLSAGRGKLMIAVIVCVAAGIAVYVVCAVLFKAVRSEDLPARLRRRAKR